MIKRIKDTWYYLWHGETKEEHDKRQAEQAAKEAELEIQRKAAEARREAIRKAEEAELEAQRKAREAKREAKRKAEEAEREAKELAYQKFLETNEVTLCEEDKRAPIVQAIDAERELRRQATRRAKEFSDEMGD